MKTNPKTIACAIALLLLFVVTASTAINATPMTASPPMATLALAPAVTPTVPTFATVIPSKTNSVLTMADFAPITNLNAVTDVAAMETPPLNLANTAPTVTSGQSPPNAPLGNPVNDVGKVGKQPELATPAITNRT